MLHEILLSLSGRPSPLLRAAASAETHGGALDAAGLRLAQLVSPPERALLASVARLSELHAKLLTFTAQAAAEHPSTICRAVAPALDSVHLAAFQAKVLEVEATILRKDAALVGAYNIVPLTAVVGAFDGWTRRMVWLWELVQFMTEVDGPKRAGDRKPVCTGSALIDRLRGELQTGYADIEDTARTLVRAAEVAWLKQVSTWILYGRLPSFGADDFFVQKTGDEDEDFVCKASLLPAFVTPSTASSMLFIGRSLNHIRTRIAGDTGLHGTDHLSSQLKELSKLTYPLESASFSRTIEDIRQYLSRTTLQKLLPLAKVMDILHLLREFFLLSRGEFAMALTQQADEKIRSRWRRADNLAYEKRDGLATVVVKDGEVSAVLERTWAAMGSMQGQHAEEDEGLERARELIRLTLAKSKSSTPITPSASEGGLASIAPTPFRNLLFSVPVVMTMHVDSPLDLFLSQSDMQTYTMVNSYLLSIRRAHIRLTDLWKITSLRRHHPPPPGPPYGSTRGGREKVRQLRARFISRSNALRSAWATASAAVFFLAETETYLQTEVVAGLWEGFQRWLTTGSDQPMREERPKHGMTSSSPEPEEEQDDIWLAEAASSQLNLDPAGESCDGHGLVQPHDPQTLAVAHRLYLRTLVHRLLLDQLSFTECVYELLVQIDHLVALVHRLHGIWTSADLEEDAGVVDAFVDLEREDRDVRADLRAVEGRVKRGVENVVAELRSLETGNTTTLADDLDGVDREDDGTTTAAGMDDEGRYIPRRVGGVDRLLMKLDFGTWFRTGKHDGSGDEVA